MDALAMTEPGAGSDVRGMSCTAPRWRRLGGQRDEAFHLGRDHADFFIVFVATGVDETPKGPRNASPVSSWTAGIRASPCATATIGQPPGLQELHPGVRRLPPAGRAGAGRGRWRVRGDEHLALRHAPDRGGVLRGPRAALFRPCGRPCRRAPAVRPADREVPGGEFPGRRHDHRDRRRRLADAGGGLAAGSRACPPTARSRAPSSMPPRCWRVSPTRRCRSSAAWG
jgi:hypothetical protein